MKISKKGIDFIKNEEGLRLNPYTCSSGVATIGYGSTFYIDGRKVTLKDSPITQKKAEELLLNTLSTFEHALNSLVTSKLNQNQFDALMSFIYNIGIGAFKTSTLLKRVNKNPSDRDIENQFIRWNKVTDPRGKLVKSPGLTNRRNRELELYFS